MILGENFKILASVCMVKLDLEIIRVRTHLESP